MGCWNETCAISNLPILHGDKVKVFVLNHYYNAVEPICLPFTAEYNDYGGVEKVESNWVAHAFVNRYRNSNDFWLQDNLTQKQKNSKKIEQILNDIERGRIQMQTCKSLRDDGDELAKNGNKLTHLSIYFVLKEVYQHAIEQKMEKWYQDSFDKDAAELACSINQKFTWKEEEISERMAELYFSVMARIDDTSQEWTFKHITLENKEQVIKDFIDAKKFVSYMNRNRRNFYRIFQKGSQNAEWNEAIKLADLVKGIATTKIKVNKEEL